MGLYSSARLHARVWLKSHLPESAIRAIRAPGRGLRSLVRRSRRGTLPTIELDHLVNDLKATGIKPGDIIMVHTSLSRIGNVANGAETVVESLIQAVSPDGTLIMPCYNSADEAIKRSEQGKPLDLRTTPAVTGKVTEAFRTWPGVVRSSHPFSSACAIGPHADYVTGSHADDPHVCHAASPVGRLVELQGKVIGIGIPIAQGLGVAHYLEDVWENFPFRVHVAPCSVTYIDARGNTVTREVIRFDPLVARTRIDYPAGRWIGEKLTEHLERRGILMRFGYGEANSWIMSAPELFEELKRLAAKNVTMYLTPDKLTRQNREYENW